MLPFLELLRVGKRDAVNALEIFTRLIALPIARRVLRIESVSEQEDQHASSAAYLGDGERFHLARVANVRTAAQIDQGSTSA